MLDLIEQKYDRESGWVVVPEVPSKPGFSPRYADAVALNLWSSRGHQIIGFEIKASRGDWLKELEQPEKSESFMRYCDHWFLAITDPNIIRDGELPINWGLMVKSGGEKRQCLKVVKAAPDLTPDPMTRSVFVAYLSAFIKRSSDAAILAKIRQDAHNEGYKCAQEQHEREKQHTKDGKLESRFKTLQTRLNELTGDYIWDVDSVIYHLEKMAPLLSVIYKTGLKDVLTHEFVDKLGRIENMLKGSLRDINSCKDAAQALSVLPTQAPDPEEGTCQ